MSFLKEIKDIPIVINDLFTIPQHDARHDYENVFLKSQRDIIKLISCPLTKASILILGCGYNYPELILFSNISKYVLGIDIMGRFYKQGLIRAFRDIRDGKRAIAKPLLKSMLERYKYYKYYHYLEKISGVPIEHQKYKVLSYNGYQMPFKDETFDLVFSNGVFQEVPDLERLFQEISRVTKKQGVSYHFWLNYYSFAGWYAPQSLRLKYPWGHLRGKGETLGLNKLTPGEIQSRFSKYFNIIALNQVDKSHRKKGIDNDFQFEREELLSESIKNELRAYPKELLLTKSYLIVGRKKGR